MNHFTTVNNLLTKLSKNRIINNEMEKDVRELREKILNQTKLKNNENIIKHLDKSINELVKIKLRDQKVLGSLEKYKKLHLYNNQKKDDDLWDPVDVVDVGIQTKDDINNLVNDFASFKISLNNDKSYKNNNDVSTGIDKKSLHNEKYSTKLDTINEKLRTNFFSLTSQKTINGTPVGNKFSNDLNNQKSKNKVDVVELYIQSSEGGVMINFGNVLYCFGNYLEKRCLFIKYLNDDIEEIFFCSNSTAFSYSETECYSYISIKGEANAFNHSSIENFILKFYKKEEGEYVYHKINN